MGAGHAHALYVHEHSPVHRLPPEVKLAAAFATVFAVGLTPRDAVWAFALDGVALAVVIGLARLRPAFVLTRMVAVLPFILFAFLIPFIAEGDEVAVLGMSLSREGLWGTWNIVAKAVLGIVVSIVLAATTEVPDMLRGMARLRVPWVFTSVAGFMVRYLELIAGELSRQRIAMRARGYEPRWLWDARPIATSAGALFVRSYERGERIHAAMVARGYAGTMPRPDDRSPAAAEWAAALGFAALPVAIAVIAIIS
jgi:cobalt/nickel transport system permease protein